MERLLLIVFKNLKLLKRSLKLLKILKFLKLLYASSLHTGLNVISAV